MVETKIIILTYKILRVLEKDIKSNYVASSIKMYV